MKKMTNLTRIVNGNIETAKAEFAERRIMKALEIAKMNAEEQLVMAQEEKATFTMGCMSAENVVSTLAAIINRIKDAEDTLATLEELERYLTANTTKEKSEEELLSDVDALAELKKKMEDEVEKKGRGKGKK